MRMEEEELRMVSPFLDQLMSTEVLSVSKPTQTRRADSPASMVRFSEMMTNSISPAHESTIHSISFECTLIRCLSKLTPTDMVYHLLGISRSHLLFTTPS